MECELCGRVCSCRPALVDGVRMNLCPDCIRHGTVIKTPTTGSNTYKKPVLERIRKPTEKDVLRDMGKKLVSNWNTLIKNAREKKSLSREELGFRIGERTVTISKFENGELRPSDKTAQKLEKELNINLFEEISEAPSYSTKTGSGSRLTLGDFIKKEEK